ncbi:transcription initiation factor IIF subunit beta [Micractinium conductrix]|uniref:Transcription initiation factor IIF subunit beta n=1 Tax=Micractinium conductrix TaxID=554055 RepID=A0A2P6VAS8_9CHLO|nr:transcription initiation factor IIF subunit beta [Micractinium conductrix]|eukprot:PSC71197.1 transcription initiation factor IIF subunit beta [Micractinium conductrix]
MAEEKAQVWRPSEELQTESANRKLWLVKVPTFVAKRWKACCEQSAERGEAQGRKLATLRLVPAPDAEAGAPKTLYQLQLDASVAAGIPQEFVMKNTTKFADPMLAFSDAVGALASEGKVWQKFDCEVARKAPCASGAGAASVALDPEYRALSRARHQAAAVKTRTVQYLQDTKLIGAPTTVQIGQKRKEVSEKRDRMDAGQLTSILFRFFEKQPRWNFAQLQKDTHQPTQHLKEVLAEIAVKNPRGPYKDLWELKKEYRAGGEEAGAAAAQQQQQQQQQPPAPS